MKKLKLWWWNFWEYWLRQQLQLRTPKVIKRTHRKIGRNEPCRCGSGKKYKRCHWNKDYKRGVV